MKQINSRIRQKYDILSNWTTNDIVLLDGELAIVDCGNQTKFKVGNGLSTFNQLPFTDQSVLSTKWVTANAISQGIHAQSVPYGLAAGAYLSAGANFSQAFGYNAAVLSTDSYAFTWNGDDTRFIGNYYASHGKGTFNLNPLSGADGIFIGEQSLQQILDSSSSKVFIDDRISSISGKNDLSVVKLNASDYAALLTSDSLLSNAIYIVEDDHIDAYGQQVKNIAPAIDLSDAVNFEQMASAVNSLSDVYQPKSNYLVSSDVSLSYSSKTLWLSSQQYVTSVDCTDFIKDGMLSSAQLCGTVLWLAFNTDASADSISIQLSDFVDDYDDKIQSLSDAISANTEACSKKIFFDDRISSTSGYNDLSVIKLSTDEYASLLNGGNLVSNAIYVVDNPYVNAYGEQIKNVLSGVDATDAATVGQLADRLSTKQDIISDINDIRLSAQSAQPAGDYLSSSATAADISYGDSNVSAEIGRIHSDLSMKSSISVDGQLADVDIVHISHSDYAQLVTTSALLSNVVYIVSSDHLDAYGEQIKNVAAPTDLSDATTKEYVDNAIPTDLSSFTNSQGYLTKTSADTCYLSSNALEGYSTYNATVSSLSSEGYIMSSDIALTLGSIQKSLFMAIADPQASVRSIQETLTQILNILRS